jgi:hypothetical protein
VTASNYGISSVWESIDGGVSWSSLDNNGVNLPDMPIRWGIFLPAGYEIGPGTTTNGIMLATEIGVWSTLSTEGESTIWSSNSGGLPNVRCDMIRFRKADKTIAVATHGRGVFTTVVPTVLPITMAEFKGTLANNKITLDWSTLMEQDLKQFEIFKSTNGSDFYTIGKVTASGNSNTRKDYQFFDNQVSASNFYKLKVESMNGNSTFSNIVLVKETSPLEQKMWVVNNPFRDNINLRFAKKPALLRLQLASINGNVVARQTIADPMEQVRWNLPMLPAGTYILTASADDKLFTRKVVRN